MTEQAKQIALFGATSAIAQAAARIWAAQGCHLFLCGRDPEKLDAMAADLRLRGAEVTTQQADLDDIANHPDLFQAVKRQLPDLHMVLFAHGILGDAEQCRQSWDMAAKVIHTNFLSIASLATLFANEFEVRGTGCMAVISSVAGDRGRQSNYVYGSSKAGLDAFFSGLRNRLHPAGVRVVTIKPGFVATPMTSHLNQGPLFAKPETVGKGVVRAMARGKSQVYLPWFWWPIMWLIRALPEFLFKRLKT